MIIFSNARQLAKENPDTFEAPHQSDLDAIKEGDNVKVCVQTERFWVKVTSRQGNNITGKINNDLICSDDHGLFCDMIIDFTTDNVYQTDTEQILVHKSCYVREYNFLIYADKVDAARNKVRLFTNKILPLSYDYIGEESLKDIMLDVWGLEINEQDNGNITDINFIGDEYKKEYFSLFNVLAPFVKKGSFIEMGGDVVDNHIWRWVFKNNKCYEIDATITWQEVLEE